MGKRNLPAQRRSGRPPASSRRSSSRGIWIVGAAVVVIAVAVGSYLLVRRVQDGGGGAASGPPLNVLLVTLDTTRADHLGCYGWERARTPEIDRLAREGVRFESAFSPVPVTLPAHASLLTGLYPFAHGVRNNGNFYLAGKFQTLATILKGRGYRTAAFVSSFILDRRYGLQRGFATYDDRMDTTKEGGEQSEGLEVERRGDHTAAALDAWLTAYAREPAAPFFAWLHLYDPHEPYWPPQPFRDQFAGALYDGEIAFDDAIVGQLVERLGDLGLLDRTLIAIVADHGESLGDHGEETHTMFVYDSAVRVPLILWRPGLLRAGVVVHEPVRMTDVAPTVLDLVRAPALTTGAGRSLRPLIDGRASTPPPPIYIETLVPQLYMNWAPLRGIRDERWKYIEAPKPELYDLAADPGESRNVHDERPQTVRGLRQQLERITAGATQAQAGSTMDRETLDKLASLGYVAGGAEPVGSPNGTARPDPKDMVGLFNRLRRAPRDVQARRYAETLPVLRDVIAKDSRNAFAQILLGTVYMGMGDYRSAISQYRKHLELVPTAANTHALIATCYEHLKDSRNAIREAEAALAIDPKFSDARLLKARVLATGGDYRGALAEGQATIEADPMKPRLHFEFAKLLAQAGQTAAAEAQFRSALELQPDYATALAGLGTLYAREGRDELAAQMLTRAVQVAPHEDEARFNLGMVYERMGRLAEARNEYQQLATAPTAAPAVAAAARKQLAALARTRPQ